ncbi:MarR family winged helix-turn-helix transcriptional regulator [Pendulispora albinea]|uniref:MarR family winged helix-turn-helix transcriptional regulator n=1 Tax=Pendulispora albinea TaxID=2741071 RepID=A0ABZ2M4Z4_9BACT
MVHGLGTKLRRLVSLLDGDVERIYEHAGVAFRARYYPVYQALEAEGSCTIRALAVRSGLTHSALSQTISEMLGAGLVVVVRGEDARERKVHLSAKGQRVMAVLQPYWDAISAAALSLDQELEVSLSRALDGAAEALERRSFYERVSAELGAAGERATRVRTRTPKKAK